MLRALSIVFLILFITCHSYSQIDKEFWFAVPEVTENHADRPIYLRFQSYDKPVTVIINIPSNPSAGNKTIQMAANASRTLAVTDWINLLENIQPDLIQNKGLHIVADHEISVYYEVYGTNDGRAGTNSDLFPLKGRNALGTLFFTPFQTRFDNYFSLDYEFGAWASFDIVATQDHTEITITPSQSIVGHAAGVPFTIILNKGQTWSGRSLSPDHAFRPAGSMITSTKPIAVTVKDDSMLKGSNWDLGGDQIVPVSQTGTEYIVLKHTLNDNILNDNDYAYVLATEDNTEVYIGGSTTADAILQKGEQKEYTITEALYINTTKAVYVLHCTGFGNELAEAILPKLSCSGSKKIGFIRSNDENLVLNVLVKNGGQNTFTINGNSSLLTASDFTAVNGTGGLWFQASKAFNTFQIPPATPNTIASTTHNFHLSVMNGQATNTGFRYGYFSDFGFVDLGPDTTICRGDSIELSAGIQKDSYLWTPGNETTSSIFAKDSATYTVSVTKEGCQYKDTLHLSFYPDAGILLPVSRDSMCEGKPVILKANPGFSTYTWSTGSRTDSVVVFTTGPVYVIAQDANGCIYKDTALVKTLPLPQGQITYSPADNPVFCEASSVTFTAPDHYTTYLWHTGASTQTIQTVQTIDDLYRVTLTDSLGCINTLEIEVDCSIYIEVPNLITLNNDGKNDYFQIRGIKPNRYRLEVYTAWGDLVYRNDSYNNDWNAADLKDGIYYYSLIHVKGKKNSKGWIHVVH